MTSDWSPSWSQVEKIEGGGRYPLGLNRFHSGLDELLIKSITEVGNRLRYMTYYCWAIGDIHKHNRSLRYEQFLKSFRLRENALTIGLMFLQPDYTFNGKDNPQVRSSVEKEACSLDFPLMQSNRLGAFGLYYVGPMQNLGLVEINTAGLYALTPKGNELYEIHERFLAKRNPQYVTHWRDKDTVPTQVVSEWGKINDLNAIRSDPSSDERNMYQSLYFRLDKKETVDLRRQSLCIFLESILRCGMKNTQFSETVLKNIHYYGYFPDKRGSLVPFHAPDYLKDALYYWMIYEGNGYFRGWLERYFQVFLEFLKSRDKGATIDEFFASISGSEINTFISQTSGKQQDYFSLPMEEIFRLYPHPPYFDSPISEESLFLNEKTDNTNTVLAKFVLTTTSLQVKFDPHRQDRRYLFIQNRRTGDLWFDRLFSIPSIRKITVRDFLRHTLKEYVIRQHDLVMFEKHDLRKCWFTTEQDKYFFQAETTPLWRPAKYRTIMSFLRDMNIITDDNGHTFLTQEGQKLYKILKEEYFHE